MDIDKGLKLINIDYDEKMKKEILYLGCHGIDIKKHDPGTAKYRNWIERKNKNYDAGTNITKDRAKSIHNQFQKEIDYVVGRRVLKNG